MTDDTDAASEGRLCPCRMCSDVERATDDVRDGLHCDLAAVQTPQEQDQAVSHTLQRLERGWRLVPPALPAGREDEAAVVDDDVCRESGTSGLCGWCDEPIVTVRLDDLDFITRWITESAIPGSEQLARLREAVAAARGLRTPHPGAGRG